MLARFGIRLPADLVVLSRALVTLDGTLRVLAPDAVARDRGHRDDDVGDRTGSARPRRR